MINPHNMHTKNGNEDDISTKNKIINGGTIVIAIDLLLLFMLLLLLLVFLLAELGMRASLLLTVSEAFSK